MKKVKKIKRIELSAVTARVLYPNVNIDSKLLDILKQHRKFV